MSKRSLLDHARLGPLDGPLVAALVCSLVAHALYLERQEHIEPPDAQMSTREYRQRLLRFMPPGEEDACPCGYYWGDPCDEEEPEEDMTGKGGFVRQSLELRSEELTHGAFCHHHDVRVKLKTRHRALEDCLARAAARSSDTLTLHWLIQSDGETTDITLEPPVPSERVSRCLERVFDRTWFEPPFGTCRVSVPVVFEPKSEPKGDASAP